jgi:hypothetical protein
MKSAPRLLLVPLVLAGLIGCTARETDSVRTIPVSSDETPNLRLEQYNVSAAAVGVEGQQNTPRLRLVPKYEPLELTPEEKRALGIEEPLIDFLAFYRPPSTGPVASFRGGLETGIDRPTGVSHAHGPHGGIAYTGPRGAVPVGTDSLASGVSAVGRPGHKAWGIGPRGGIAVGEGTSSGVAATTRATD